MDSHEQRLRGMYAAFNERDIDGVLDAMTPDVDWPNGWEGGRVLGREAVRDYWSRQWAQIDPRVDPVSVATRPDGRIAVEVRQRIQDRDGNLLADAVVIHSYTLRGDLIARMDIEQPG